MAVKVQTATGETYESPRLKVGDTVRVSPKFAHYNPKSIYVGRVGVIQIDDGSSFPFYVHYKDISESRWFREGELVLAPLELQTIDSIKHTILEILDGKVFYAPDGTKIHMQEGILKYGEELLNLEKLAGTPLTSKFPNEPPFEIDSIKGTHCEVWDFDDDEHEYALITGYYANHAYKFKANDLSQWKYAKPVK